MGWDFQIEIMSCVMTVRKIILPENLDLGPLYGNYTISLITMNWSRTVILIAMNTMHIGNWNTPRLCAVQGYVKN